MRTTLLAVASAVALGAAVPAQAAGQAVAEMHDRDGASVGSVSLEAGPNGVLLHARLKRLPPGTHAFHIHGAGSCEPPFKSAGGHFDPDGAAHGLMSAAGPHAGDMPNIHVPASGELTVEVFNARLRLDDALLDDDGAAVMLHAGADDYRSDPAGAAGERIACGVIEAR